MTKAEQVLVKVADRATKLKKLLQKIEESKERQAFYDKAAKISKTVALVSGGMAVGTGAAILLDKQKRA